MKLCNDIYLFTREVSYSYYGILHHVRAGEFGIAGGKSLNVMNILKSDDN